MISEEDLEQLRYKGESVDLDFKQSQYPFAGATEHQKSELLKDILAMANAYRAEPGFILIGFKDQPPHPAEVVGISSSDHIDDAVLQQFVRSKVDPILEFQYEERLFGGKHIAIIKVPKQARPFAPIKDYGKLKKNVVYVRRGSSTDEATMSEMTKMTLADAGAPGTVQVDLQIEDEENGPLPVDLTRRFLEFGDIPDYEEENYIDMGNGFRTPISSTRLVNQDYYRDGANYHSTMNRMVMVRLSLANRSDFPLGDVKLELCCSASQGDAVQMMRSDDLPAEPESGELAYLGRGLEGMVDKLRQRVAVDERTSEPVCHVLLGTLRPGETGRAETDIALLPKGPGDYVLRVRILANNIGIPLVKEHAFTIRGEVNEVGAEDLIQLLYGKYFDLDVNRS
ncbi:AlbA family DNA-binding domain-containing protein [Halopseudomonas pelagia]|uniref:AlbA family DNA-binding domain-containing protein n=1 Tax=Halopseudomonas pelagia TaxID=553151 RepID=UPI0003A92F5A|nr:ATP-binding protein [Halopseudomonas pelagia]